MATHEPTLGFLLRVVNRTSSADVVTGCNMPESKDASPGDRLRQLRESKGLSALQLAHRVGRSESAVRNQENGTNGIPATLARKYAQALGVTAAYLLYGDESTQQAVTPSLTMLPLRDRVQAGAWLPADDSVQVMPKSYPAAKDERFPHAEQWLSQVVGDSVDQLGITDGDLVHCVSAFGYTPRNGDIVEVERLRFQGRERELTIKQVEITPEGAVLLQPRSHNPRWQEPILMTEGLAPDDTDVEVSVRGLVVAAIRRF